MPSCTETMPDSPAANVPSLPLEEKVSKFSKDLEALKVDKPYKTLPDSGVAIPSFQRQGMSLTAIL